MTKYSNFNSTCVRRYSSCLLLRSIILRLPIVKLPLDGISALSKSINNTRIWAYVRQIAVGIHIQIIYYSHLNRIFYAGIHLLWSYKFLILMKQSRYAQPSAHVTRIRHPSKIFMLMPLIQNMQICVRFCHTSLCSRLDHRHVTRRQQRQSLCPENWCCH